MEPLFPLVTGFLAAARADIGAGDDLLEDVLLSPLPAVVVEFA